jgi:hypothetical protein
MVYIILHVQCANHFLQNLNSLLAKIVRPVNMNILYTLFFSELNAIGDTEPCMFMFYCARQDKSIEIALSIN